MFRRLAFSVSTPSVAGDVNVKGPDHRSRNKWRKLPACDATISRKLGAYATEKSDTYFSNGANQRNGAETMKGKIGLWVDHEKAVIVTIEDKHEKVEELLSEVQRYSRLAGGARSSTPYGPQDVASEKKHQRRHDHELHKF
jgi:hypothetical protein